MKKTNDEGEEVVCLTEGQMANILDADRAFVTGDKKKIKKACPKALSFVKTHPLKESNEPDIIDRVSKKAEKIALRKIRSKITEKYEFLKGLF